MEYKSIAQMAEQWGVSDRRMRILCHQGKIDVHTARYQQNDSPYAKLFAEVDALKAELDKTTRSPRENHSYYMTNS